MLRSFVIVALLALVVGVGFVWREGGKLVAPAQRAVGPAPAALGADSVPRPPRPR